LKFNKLTQAVQNSFSRYLSGSFQALSDA